MSFQSMGQCITEQNIQDIMKYFYSLIFLRSFLLSMFSCTATNNLYVNNPVPMGKGNAELYLGLGTGVVAKIDSISLGNGAVNFSNRISNAPILSLGSQIGLSKQTDLRIAIHFPWIVGGFGFRAGIQHSFFDSNSRINMAIGSDLGFVVSKDSIEISGTNVAIGGKSSNGAISADLFLPISFKIKNDFRVVVTPRYSLTTIYIREYQDKNGAKPFSFHYPALSLGIRVKRFYFETTVLYYFNSFAYHHFGAAWFINK